ncbi:hypothetical protein EC968_007062 [Mortierella alpina]|nr:hypothetical protein EC968_007062 [Mortierella alpina]
MARVLAVFVSTLLLVIFQVCANPNPGIYHIGIDALVLTTPSIGDIAQLVLVGLSSSQGPRALWEVIHAEGKNQVYIRVPNSDLSLSYSEPRVLSYLRALPGAPRLWTLLETAQEGMFLIQSPVIVQGEYICANKHPVPSRAGLDELDEPGSSCRKPWKFTYVSPVEN